MKRRTKILSLLLAMLMIVPMLVPAFTVTASAASSTSAWNGSIATSFAGGAGTKTSPYLISNGAELAYLAKLVNDPTTYESYAGKYYNLTADIDLGNQEWTPIGGTDYTSTGVQYPFKGYFDGKGFEIRNMMITKEKNVVGAGLFGSTQNATVRNFTLRGTINAAAKSQSAISGVGMITAASYGTTMAKLTVYVDINIITSSAQQLFVGGFIGYSAYSTKDTVLTNCNAYGQITFKHASDETGWATIGGIVGRSRQSKMVNTHVAVDINVPAVRKDACVGGLVGFSDGNANNQTKDATILRGCSYSGNINVTASKGILAAGGMIGCAGYGASHKTTEGATQDDIIGALTQGGTIELTDCFYDGEIYAKSMNGDVYEGAMIGLNRAYIATIKDLYASTPADYPFYTNDPDFTFNANQSDTSTMTVLDTGKRITNLTIGSATGVAVRLTSGSTGLRYNSTIKRDLYDTLVARTDLKFTLGTIITPESYVDGALDFTKEMLEAYRVENEFTNAYVDVVFDPAVNPWLDDHYKDETVHYFSGAITNLYEQNYNRSFAGSGYLQITTKLGYSYTFYADYNDAARARSASYVATKALADRNATETVVYDNLTEDGDWSPYSKSQRDRLAVFADAYDNTFTTTNLRLFQSGLSAYSIVYPAGSTAEKALASYMQHIIRIRTGVTLPVYDSCSGNRRASGREIVVGCNDYADYRVNISNFNNQYSVFTSGNRVVILGDTANALSAGIQAFLEPYFTVKVSTATSIATNTNAYISVPRFTRMTGTATAKPVNTSLSDYMIVYSNANDNVEVLKRMAYSLQQSYLELTGTTLSMATSGSGKQIKLVTDTTLAPGSWTLTNSSNVITIKASTYYGFEGAEDYLLVESLYGMAPITTSGFQTSGTYKTWLSEYEEAQQFAYEKMGEQRIMFYNVLFGNDATAPANDRNYVQAEMIEQYMPDVLGCQEFNITKRGNSTSNTAGTGGLAGLLSSLGYVEAVDPRVKNAYATTETILGTDASLTVEGATAGTKLNGYGVGGATQVTVGGETYYTYYNNTPLFYNKNTTTLIKAEYYWYKNQWNKLAGVNHENGSGDCASKSATWGVFENKSTGDRYIVISTHMCTRDDYIRGLQAKELTDLIATLIATYEVPVFLGGDLNGNSDDANYKHFVSDEVGYTDLTSRELCKVFNDELASSHGYPELNTTLNIMQPGANEDTRFSSDSIDRILMTNSSNIVPYVYGVVSDDCSRGGSDHLPIFLDFSIAEDDSYTDDY